MTVNRSKIFIRLVDHAKPLRLPIAISYILQSQTRVPLAELRHITNVPISERTIRRQLKESGIRKWKAVIRPLLMNMHAAERLKWAREHQHWTRDDWIKVAWSDESAIQKDSDYQTV